MLSKKAYTIILTLLALFLIGTVTVLSVVQVYFGIDARDVIRLEEVDYFVQHPSLPFGSDGQSPTDILGSAFPVEKVPRIIHQTWKNETLPERWRSVRDQCLAMHPDFEYKLWTDDLSRRFLAEHYPWFLDNFDNYAYPIQRADAIRYFVLHHFGGVYMDLDIGCRRPVHPLLHFDVILPRTKPVGISNDLMFASPKHPFMNLVIQNLLTFDHSYGTNYPTVMFSTGPMFLSAQYGIWPKWREAATEDGLLFTERQKDVRVLPKAFYGKNARDGEAEQSFFWHFYGSSWHSDDAGFVTFLGNFGMFLLYAGLFVCLGGSLRLLWGRRKGIPSGSLPFSFSHPLSQTDGHLSGYSTPISRPSSPLPPPYPDSKQDYAASSRNYLAWVPVYLSADQQPGWSTPSVGLYPPAALSAESEKAALHAMHPLKHYSKSRRKHKLDSDRRKWRRTAAVSDHSTDESDLESQAQYRKRVEAGKSLPTWLGWATSFFSASSTQQATYHPLSPIPRVSSPLSPKSDSISNQSFPPPLRSCDTANESAEASYQANIGTDTARSPNAAKGSE